MGFQQVDPATGAEGATYAFVDAARIDAALDAAQEAFRAWRETPYDERAAVLRRVAALLEERAADLARLMAREMGKPLAQGEAEVEKCAVRMHGTTPSTPRRSSRTSRSRRRLRADLRALRAARHRARRSCRGTSPSGSCSGSARPPLMAGNGILLKHAPNVPGCALAIESGAA